MIYKESDVQRNCVRWFRLQYPSYKAYLFAVPNGGKRTLKTAQIMKAEGQLAGVADLLLLYPCCGYMGLCIEMKTEKGVLSAYQKQWREKIEEAGYRYVVCRSAKEFAEVVSEYLAGGRTMVVRYGYKRNECKTNALSNPLNNSDLDKTNKTNKNE